MTAHRRAWVHVAGLALLVLLVALGGVARGLGNPPTLNPHSGMVSVPSPTRGGFPGEALVLNTNCPDPSVTRDGGSSYWMVCTETGDGVPLYHSDDLRHWTLVSSSLLPPDMLPSWTGESGLWAPTLVHLANGWVVYVSAEDALGQHHILVGTAPAPAGPWTAEPAPLVSNPEGAIDPSYFLAPGHTRYLVWKVDANAQQLPSYLQMQELNAAGTGLLGQPRTLIRADRPRERRVVEGPVLVHHGGWYYLFYSENVYTSLRYAVGVARARSLEGPWRKQANPILHSVAPWYGPGGETITTDPRGQQVMLWHADWGPAWVGFRRVLAGRLLWGNHGWPQLAVR